MAGGIFSMILVLWLSLGQNFSKTLTKQPWMPHNPINQCYMNDSFDHDLNITWYIDKVQNDSLSSYKSTTPSMDEYDEIINAYWNYKP